MRLGGHGRPGQGSAQGTSPQPERPHFSVHAHGPCAARLCGGAPWRLGASHRSFALLCAQSYRVIDTAAVRARASAVTESGLENGS